MIKQASTRATRWARMVVVILLALCFVLVRVPGALAQDSDPPQGEAQEENGLAVAVTRIESDAFPHTVAYVTVTGKDGLPLEGLQANNFELVEDGVEIPFTSIVTLKDDSTQGFRMVLAVDVSTYIPENLAQVREAIKSFIDTLGPQDELAIIAFHDEVRVVQDFSANKEDLIAAVDTLSPEGDFTALNAVLIESAKMAGGVESGRGVAVVLTDSPDNVRDIPVNDAIDQILETGAPVYTVCYGPEVQSPTLPQVAHLMRGQAFALSNPPQVQDALQAIKELLRQGYGVVFQSGLLADDAEHALAVKVSHQEQTGQAQGHFLAVSGEVLVSLSGIVDGQQVVQGDIVTLTTRVEDAPAPPVSVEYWLDDHPLPDAADASAYRFKWNSTSVPPGSHELRIEVKDRAGNGGRDQVNFDVVLPVEVTGIQVPEEIELGGMLVITAQVEPPDRAISVEFLLDSEHLGYADLLNYPYKISVSSSEYVTATSEHTITVHVVDALGRQIKKVSPSIKFVAPPKSKLWLKILSAVSVAMLGFAIAIIAFVFLIGAERKQRCITYPLKIVNQGNMDSRYRLRLDGLVDGFKCEFAHNGTALEQPQEGFFVPGDAPTQVSSNVKEQSSSVDASSVAQTMSKGKRRMHAMATWINSVASFLPFARTPLSRASGTLRRGEQQVSQVERSSRRAQAAKKLASPGELQPATSTSSPQTVAQSSATPVQTVAPTWRQTPSVKPGETLTVDLQIQPPDGMTRANSEQSNSDKTQAEWMHSFEVYSGSVERQEDARSAKMDIRFVRLPWYSRYYPFIVFALILGVSVVLSIMMLRG